MIYPKGTTEAQWKQYEAELREHEERVERERPDPENYPSEAAYMSAVSEWKMMRSCDAPNEPGYYRANND